MDCKLKTCSQVWLIALFLPTLLWGYGKSAVGLAQNEEDAKIGVGEDNRKSKAGSGTADSKSGNPKAKANGTAKPRLNTQVSVQATNPVAEVDAETSTTDAEGTEKKTAKGSDNTASADSPEVDRDRNEGIVEPDLTNGTYNQVRAKKPSIPSRFDGQDGFAGQNENGDDLNRVSVFGLLGIPTVVFGLLFFVMWGIISGRIQRIMF